MVGDDDQSIYGWRGARVENMQRFQRDYPGRRWSAWSRTTAPRHHPQGRQRLIANNPERLGKKLWTSGGEGEPIRLYAAFNEVDEAASWSAASRTVVRQGYRAPSAPSSTAPTPSRGCSRRRCCRAQMPYRVYGGLRFFERAEIKDAMAYLRLIANRDDDARLRAGRQHPDPRHRRCAPWIAALEAGRYPGR
jgi:DNA helicase-2/ATP-dependent DNA helicase PcrA